MSQARPLARSLFQKIVRIAPLIVAVAVIDWILKALARGTGQRYVFSFLEDKPIPPHVAMVMILGLALLTHLASSRLSLLGLGLTLGALLGNSGELAAFHRVTDFIPYRPGYLASPADLCLVAGLLLIMVGVTRDVLTLQQAARKRRLAKAS